MNLEQANKRRKQQRNIQRYQQITVQGNKPLENDFSLRLEKTRRKKRGGALNKLYGEALNRKPKGFDDMYLSRDVQIAVEGGATNPFEKPTIYKRAPKTRRKKRGGALNKLYGEALNRKPKGAKKPRKKRAAKKPLPKMNERSKRSIQLDRARVSNQKHEQVYQKRKRRKKMDFGMFIKKKTGNPVRYIRKDNKVGFKIWKIAKKGKNAGKGYWKYLGPIKK